MYKLLLGYVFLALIVFRLGFVSPIRQVGSGGLMLVSGAFGLFYCVFPTLLILLGEQATRQSYVYQRFGVGDYWTLITISLTFIAFWLGYVVRVRTTARKDSTWALLHSREESAYLRKIAYVFVSTGLIGLTYQAVQAGGAIRMLEMSSCVRGNVCGMTGDLVFLRQLNYFIATGFMAYCAAHYQDEMNGVRSNFIPLLLFGGVFVYQAASTAGRRDILYPLMICCLMLYSAGYRKSEGFLVLFGAGIAWWGLTLISSSAYLDARYSSHSSSSAIDFFFGWNYAKNVFLDVIRGVGDTFMHFVAMQHVGVGQFGFLRDWTELPLEFMPTRFLGIDRGRGVMGEITSYMLGQELSHGFSGEEPPGLHGYILVNLGIFGAIVFFFASGWLVRWVDEKFYPRSHGASVKWLIYFLIMWLLLEYIREGVISLIVKPRFSWIALIVFVVLIDKRIFFRKGM